jgi:hypothetical protein
MNIASSRAAFGIRCLFPPFPGQVSAGKCLCKGFPLIDSTCRHLATGCPKCGQRKETHDRFVHELDNILKYSGFWTVPEEYGAFLSDNQDDNHCPDITFRNPIGTALLPSVSSGLYVDTCHTAHSNNYPLSGIMQ